MKKIAVMRSSGHPINLDDLSAYREEWKEIFDRVMIKCRVQGSPKVLDTLRSSKLLDRIESILSSKYKNVAYWDFTKTKKAWQEILNEYGNIMITRRADTDEIIYVIMDEPQI